MRQRPLPRLRSLLALSLVAGIAVTTSGCAYTMGDFGERGPAATPAATDATSAMPMKPATYVVDTTGAPQGALPRAVSAEPLPASYPNLGAAPHEPKSKLLTPEEKAKVIADLEALAKSQEAAVEKSRKAAAAACGSSVKNALDPEAKLKSEAAGQGC